MTYHSHFEVLKKGVDHFIGDYLGQIENALEQEALKPLFDSLKYSLAEGGNRVRPLLAELTAEALGRGAELVRPYGVAVELVHTYSLVHDDLPCMDDDDFRRGKAANHKVFGEALAVLAGDALNTEAFTLIAENYGSKPEVGLFLITLLSKAAGFRGMVGGQGVDITLRDKKMEFGDLEFLNRNKTGALFRAAILGAAHICEASPAQLKSLGDYAKAFGMLFQIVDDLVDSSPLKKTAKKKEPNFVGAFGIEKAQLTCSQLLNETHESLEIFGELGEGLRQMADLIAEKGASHA